MYLEQGDLVKAEKYSNSALGVFADYDPAVRNLAEVRLAQKRYDDAVELLRKQYGIVPSTKNLYALAEAQELAGKKDEAQTSFVEFERKALAQASRAHNSNRELIAYYVDHAHRLAEALLIAKQELARRHDVYTLDCYAWALAAHGDYKAAQVEISKALAVGVKDPKILNHAKKIELLVAPHEH